MVNPYWRPTDPLLPECRNKHLWDSRSSGSGRKTPNDDNESVPAMPRIFLLEIPGSSVRLCSFNLSRSSSRSSFCIISQGPMKMINKWGSFNITCPFFYLREKRPIPAPISASFSAASKIWTSMSGCLDNATVFRIRKHLGVLQANGLVLPARVNPPMPAPLH